MRDALGPKPITQAKELRSSICEEVLHSVPTTSLQAQEMLLNTLRCITLMQQWRKQSHACAQVLGDESIPSPPKTCRRYGPLQISCNHSKWFPTQLTVAAGEGLTHSLPHDAGWARQVLVHLRLQLECVRRYMHSIHHMLLGHPSKLPIPNMSQPPVPQHG